MAATIVLIVEDADVCRDALELALSRVRGIDIRMVPTAEDALSFLAKEPVVALVTDLRLPRMNGFDLIAEIRSRPACADLPIIVISGDCDPQTPARIAMLGANAYFSKPYSPAQVRSHLEHLLNVSQAMHSPVDRVAPGGTAKD